MISLVTQIPQINLPLAEIIKINCNYNLYSDVAMFWVQDETRAIISMLDGNMVVYNRDADFDELREFIGVVAPTSIFSDADTLTGLFGENFERVCVVKSDTAFTCDVKSDVLDSKEIYRALNVDGLELPPYEYFAVDYCLRLNRGQLKYFAIKGVCAAVGISDGQSVLINGISSHKKGMGSTALRGLLSQYNKTTVAVCKTDVMPFYLKNDFQLDYYAGYWRKNL